MGLLVVIVSGLALSAAPTVVKATATPTQGHCYVSGYLEVSGEVGGTPYVDVWGSAFGSNSVPWDTYYDSTYYIAQCNVQAVRIEIWPPENTSATYCFDSFYNPAGGCIYDSDVQFEPWAAADMTAESTGWWYGDVTAFGQVSYWSNANEFGIPQSGPHSAMSLEKTIDLGSSPEEDQPDDCVPAGATYCTPILIPTTKANKYDLTSAAEGVWFDMGGTGVQVLTAWTAPNSDIAFLAIDRNGNGVIDNGTELFGDATVPGKTNGFQALAVLAGKKGPIRNTDPIFSQLLLWTDRNHDGVSQPGELQPFSTLYSEIHTGYFDHWRRDGHGNLFRFGGTVVEKYEEHPQHLRLDKRKEKTRRIYDVIFVRQ
jgi:hypothetical protein